MKNTYLVLVTLIVLFFISSCVPVAKFTDEKNKRMKYEEENKNLKTINENQAASLKELTANVDELYKRTGMLEKDTSILGQSLRKMQLQYDKINKLNNELIDKLEKQKTGNLEETKKILSELQLTKDDLLQKEASLKKMENELNKREQNLNSLNQELKTNQEELALKQKKLEELQSVLDKKDSVVRVLKNKVTDALLGFENKGLTIEQKNGKVYVSMEEALLFPSGSFAVNKRGIEALKNLSNVLEANPDINVLVEGHTDNVPYKGAGQLKDNWDLSVMRATTIVKTLLAENDKIDASRLTAAGRSEYMPIETNVTKEGKAKNRRTEIILTPKLDELFKIIESN